MTRALVGSVCLTLVAFTAQAAQPSIPSTARKVILEKADAGYRWKIIEAAVPQPGDHQVLIHVRAVGLNRAEWETLVDPNPGRDYSGHVPVSDAADDVVAVGKRRYSELARSLSGISPKALSERLQELEVNHLVTRTVYPTVPPMTDYELTELGRKLEAVIRAMQEFGLLLPGANAMAQQTHAADTENRRG